MSYLRLLSRLEILRDDFITYRDLHFSSGVSGYEQFSWYVEYLNHIIDRMGDLE